MRRTRAFAMLSVVALLVLLGLPPSARAARADVAALQVALGALGLYAGTVDGISGPWTRRAVVRFQRSRGLAVDGIAGPRTRRALGRRGRPRLGSRMMELGRRGWDVAAIQFLLSRRGYGPGGFDGGFGPRTAAAVRRFQRAAGLAVDGVAGPATLLALKHRRLPPPVAGPVRFLRPVRWRYADRFGWVGGRRHTGLDFPAPPGAPVRAAGRGVVTFAGWNSGGYGRLVVVTHRLGFDSWYAHLSRISTARGRAVVGGTLLGRVGSSGRSTGPHLHFEVRQFGAPIDPLRRLLAIAAGRGSRRPLVCRPNADARSSRDADPPLARVGRCP